MQSTHHHRNILVIDGFSHFILGLIVKYLDSPKSEQLFDDADFWEVSFYVRISFCRNHQTLADGQIFSKIGNVGF